MVHTKSANNGINFLLLCACACSNEYDEHQFKLIYLFIDQEMVELTHNERQSALVLSSSIKV